MRTSTHGMTCDHGCRRWTIDNPCCSCFLLNPSSWPSKQRSRRGGNNDVWISVTSACFCFMVRLTNSSWVSSSLCLSVDATTHATTSFRLHRCNRSAFTNPPRLTGSYIDVYGDQHSRAWKKEYYVYISSWLLTFVVCYVVDEADNSCSILLLCLVDPRNSWLVMHWRATRP